TNQTTSTTVPSGSIAVSYDSGSNTASFTFPGYASGILPDGNYHATLPAGSVTDSAGNPLATDYNLDFFFLTADANHDRSVNTLDFNSLVASFNATGKSFSQGNFNYDNVVDTIDFNMLASK